MGKKRPDQVKRVHEALKANAKEAKYGIPYCKWRKEDNRWEISDASGRDASMYFYPEEERWAYQAPYEDERDTTLPRSLGNATCWYTG